MAASSGRAQRTLGKHVNTQTLGYPSHFHGLSRNDLLGFHCDTHGIQMTRVVWSYSTLDSCLPLRTPEVILFLNWRPVGRPLRAQGIYGVSISQRAEGTLDHSDITPIVEVRIDLLFKKFSSTVKRKYWSLKSHQKTSVYWLWSCSRLGTFVWNMERRQVLALCAVFLCGLQVAFGQTQEGENFAKLFSPSVSRILVSEFLEVETYYPIYLICVAYSVLISKGTC